MTLKEKHFTDIPITSLSSWLLVPVLFLFWIIPAEVFKLQVEGEGEMWGASLSFESESKTQLNLSEQTWTTYF